MRPSWVWNMTNSTWVDHHSASNAPRWYRYLLPKFACWPVMGDSSTLPWEEDRPWAFAANEVNSLSMLGWYNWDLVRKAVHRLTGWAEYAFFSSGASDWNEGLGTCRWILLLCYFAIIMVIVVLMKGLVTPSDVRSKCKGGNDSHSSPMMGLIRTDFGATAATSFLATQLPADAFSSWQFWGLPVGVSFLRWEIIPGGEYSEALASCANQPWKRTSSGFNFFYGGSNSWIGSAMSVLGPVSFTRVLDYWNGWRINLKQHGRGLLLHFFGGQSFCLLELGRRMGIWCLSQTW